MNSPLPSLSPHLGSPRPTPTRFGRTAPSAFVITALAVLFTGACATPRVTLPAPPSASAPLEERVAYRDRYGAAAVVGDDPGPATVGTFPFLLLENGERVVDSRDLLPAVEPTSATASVAEKGMEGRAAGAFLSVLGSSVAALGLSAELVGIAVPAEERLEPLRAGMVYGGAAVGLTGLATWFLGLRLVEEAEANRLSAFHLYDKDLDRRLGLSETIASAGETAGAPTGPRP